MDDTVAPVVANGCVGTTASGTPDAQFTCYTGIVDEVKQYRCVGQRFFYVTCPTINQLCSQISGAYVAAVTVCNQRLF